MASLSGKLLVRLDLENAKDLTVSTPADPLFQSILWTITNGTGANQANTLYYTQATITAGSTDVYDLYDSLTDAFGDDVLLARVKALLVWRPVEDEGVANLEIGPASGNDWYAWRGTTGDLVVLPPGGIFLLACPGATAWALGADGVADELGITHDNSDAGAVIYNILVIGADA